jgi:AraC family transcriptional regulator
MDDIAAGKGLLRRRASWLGGRVELISFDQGRPTRYEATSEREHVGSFVLNGFLEVTNRRIDGNAAPRFSCRPGEINFFRMGCRVTGKITGALECVRIFIDPDFVHRSDDSRAIDRASAPWLAGSSDPLKRRLALELASHLERSPRIEPLLVDGAASLLTLGLFQVASNRAPYRLAGQLSPPQLRIVVNYIESNLGRGITLAELAGYVGLSTPQFCYAFRNSTGLSPHRYLVKQRIERAKVMLRGKVNDITEIALALGFNSQSHFTNAFRIATGNTPMRYRRENS